jgi:hypothetical protein
VASLNKILLTVSLSLSLSLSLSCGRVPLGTHDQTLNTALKVTAVRSWRNLSEDGVRLSEWFTMSCCVNDVKTGVAMITWLQWVRQSLVSEWRRNRDFHSFQAYPTDKLTIELGWWVKSKTRFEWETAWYKMRLISKWIQYCSSELYWNSSYFTENTSRLHCI